MSAITWTQTPTLYEITLPTGNLYYVSDDEVRQWIGDGTTSGAEKRLSDAESAIVALQNATHWLGITTTTLSDGSTTNPVTIDGQSVTAVGGDIVQDSNGQEYIFSDKVNPNAWQAFGASIGTLKAFAFVDTGTVTIKPKGTNSSSAVTFAGSSTDTFVKSQSATKSKLVTDTVPNVTDVGTAPSWAATVNNGNLTFSWSAGTVPTLGTAKTVATGALDTNGAGAEVATGLDTPTTGSAVTAIGTATAAAQTFTGTEESHTVNPAT